MKRRFLVAAGLCAASFALYAWRLGGRFSNGDEVIYAQESREMATRGDWLTIRWQGEAQLVRPPTSVWPLAVAYQWFGPDEAVLRGVCALESALAVAFLFAFAARRWGVDVGVVAALLLTTATLWYKCARYIESDPLLCLFIVAAMWCWERARERPRWIYGWSFCLAGALMTKPFVGVLPVLAPLGDLVERRPIAWRRLWGAVGVAALLAAPWHLYEAARFGRLFGRAFVIENVLHRSSQALHQQNGPSFYYLMLWYLEGPVIRITLLGLVWAAVKREWLVLLWVAIVLVPFTIAKSRYNYYLLPAFPALAIATALALMRAMPRWRTGVAAVAVLAAVTTHILPRAHPPDGDDEIAALAHLVKQTSQPDDVLFVIDQYSFSARFYSERHTVEVHINMNEPKSLVLPGEIVEARDFAPVAAAHRRWFAIVPQIRVAQLPSLGQPIAGSPRYQLFTNLQHPG